MCGIFGITINKASTLPARDFRKIFTELFLLSESRGKEASGFAILNNKSISVYKNPFPASELIKNPAYKKTLQFDFQRDNGSITAIGHSRLVTNGTEQLNENNQPVIKNGMVGIHNGIIVNHAELWKKCKDDHPESQLDSEVILSLLSNFYKADQSLLSALSKTYEEIYGMASVALLFKNFYNLLLATNNGSLYYIPGNDGNSFVFASEKHILNKLFSKNAFSKFFARGKITHLKPLHAVLIDLETTKFQEVTFKDVDVLKDFNTLHHEQREIPIGDISDAKGNLKEKIPASPAFLIPSDFVKIFDENQRKVSNLRRCSKCLLPESFPYIEYDKEDVCNYCRNYSPISYAGEQELEKIIAPHRSKSGEPDCLISFSGGRDSSYSLYYLKEVMGMNPVAFSYDWGMITDLARRNQSRLCGKLGIEHILVSADIRKKRNYIRQNVTAWLKRPSLGTVPLFMAGDKQFFYHAHRLEKQLGVNVLIFGENRLERTNFKTGFCNIKPVFDASHIYSLSLGAKMKMASFYLKEYLLNPSYLNRSLLDTIGAFASYYVIPHDYTNLFNYIRWDEDEINRILIDKFDWETAPDLKSTWRIGDGTASFYNYIYYTVAGFSEFDTFHSNQIRGGVMQRKDALNLIKEENKPRFESIKWYCDTIGIDFESTIKTINKIPKLY